MKKDVLIPDFQNDINENNTGENNTSENGIVSTQTIMNMIIKLFEQEKNLYINRCQFLDEFCTKLIQNNLTILKYFNKYFNNYYFRNQWSINDIIDKITYNSLTQQYAKITVLPSLGVFNQWELKNDAYVVENYTKNKHHIKPGIYVYNYHPDDNIVYHANYKSYCDVKPLAIYYIKGPQEQNTRPDSDFDPYIYKCVGLIFCQAVGKTDVYYIGHLNSVLFANENDVINSVIWEDGILFTEISRNINDKSHLDQHYQPNGYWTINKFRNYDENVSTKEQIKNVLNQLIQNTVSGDICQLVHYNSDDASCKIKYIFNLGNDKYFCYSIDEKSENVQDESVSTKMEIITYSPQPTEYNITDIKIENDDIV